MQKVFEELTTAFRKYHGVLSSEQYIHIVTKHTTLLEDAEIIFILLQASGYPIIQFEGTYRLETYFTPYQKQRYCVIDIETNGSKPGTSQVIEIGAVMLEEGKVVDRF